MLTLRRTEDGCGNDVVDEPSESEMLTEIPLFPPVPDDSGSLELMWSYIPARVGNLDGTASRCSNDNNTHTGSQNIFSL